MRPHAPFPCDYAPELRQWFSLADRAPDKLLAGLREAAALLEAWFDVLLASRGLDELPPGARRLLARGRDRALYRPHLAKEAGWHRRLFRGLAGGGWPGERDPLEAAGPPRAWRGGHGRVIPLDGRCEGGARNGGRRRSKRWQGRASATPSTIGGSPAPGRFCAMFSRLAKPPPADRPRCRVRSPSRRLYINI